MNRNIDIQLDRIIGRKINRQEEKKIDRQRYIVNSQKKDRQLEKGQILRKIDRQIEIQIDSCIELQKEKNIDRKKDRQRND